MKNLYPRNLLKNMIIVMFWKFVSCLHFFHLQTAMPNIHFPVLPFRLWGIPIVLFFAPTPQQKKKNVGTEGVKKERWTKIFTFFTKNICQYLKIILSWWSSHVTPITSIRWFLPFSYEGQTLSGKRWTKICYFFKF